MVSAWSVENSAVLGQQKIFEKSNEITAIPALLEILAIKGAIITIDAMGCQKTIAKKIISKKGDYVFGLKENHPELYKCANELFDIYPEELEKDNYEYITKGHGRIEHRICRQLAVNKKWLLGCEYWEGLKSIIEIKSYREIIGGERSVETRYYISSLTVDAKRAYHAVKDHWVIENCLHWVLDVAYREDDCRIRRENGAEFFTIMRRISANIIKKDTTKKAGVNRKRKMASMDPVYHEQLMHNFQEN